MTRKAYLMSLFALCIVCSFTSASAASQRDCLSYEPVPVTLKGKVLLKVFPGRPGFESIKAGDEPEGAWILHLAKPICVKADGKDLDNVAIGKISDFHLVLRGKQFSELHRLRKKGAVTFTGTLFHSHSPYHRTPVLLEVKSLK